MNLPTPLHAMLWQCAREPTPDWCSVERFILADYLEETGDAERAGKIRELEIREYNDGGVHFWYIHPDNGNEWHRGPMATFLTPDRATVGLRRRVLAMFPEVEFEIPGGWLVDVPNNYRLVPAKVKAPDLMPLADATDEQKAKVQSQLGRAIEFFSRLPG